MTRRFLNILILSGVLFVSSLKVADHIKAATAQQDSKHFGRLAFTLIKDGKLVIYTVNPPETSIESTFSMVLHSKLTIKLIRLVWSPDYNYLRFTSDYYWQQSSENVVISADGTASQTYNNDYINFQWSLDGKYLAYLYKQDWEKLFNLFIANPDGSEPRKLIKQQVSDYAWSPDARQIAVSAKGRIFVVTLGHEDELIPITGSYGYIHDLLWSPDGKYITFLHGLNLYVVEVATHTIHKLDAGSSHQSLLWSPDGKRIVFYDYGHKAYLVDVNNLEHQTILFPELMRDYALAWSPDSQKLWMGNGIVKSVDKMGKLTILRVINTYAQGAAAWSPDSNKIAVVLNGDICIYDLLKDEPNCLMLSEQTSVIGPFAWAVLK